MIDRKLTRKSRLRFKKGFKILPYTLNPSYRAELNLIRFCIEGVNLIRGLKQNSEKSKIRNDLMLANCLHSTKLWRTRLDMTN